MATEKEHKEAIDRLIVAIQANARYINGSLPKELLDVIEKHIKEK